MKKRVRWFAALVLLIVSLLTWRARAAAAPSVITLDPQITYQTITGWEATAQAGQDQFPASFPLYKDALFEQAVNDLGINRLRLELFRKPGAAGKQTGEGFDLVSLDSTVGGVILPIRELLRARGETLFVNACVVGNGYAKDPTGYAQAALEAVRHLQSKYGLVPDSWEVALEPDNFRWGDPGSVANALVATGKLFEANGYHIPFVGPSNADMTSAVSWFDAIMQTPGAAQYLKELSYHRYGGVSSTSLKAIADRAQHHGINSSMLEHIGSGIEDLYQDLTVGQVSTWQEYGLAWKYNGTDEGGLYYLIDLSDLYAPKVTLASRAKLLRQYFKFIRRGAVRIQAQTTDDRFAPVGFVNSNRTYVVVVKASVGGSLSIQGLPSATYGINYTTNVEYAVDLQDQTISAGQSLTTAIPAAGVITIYGKTQSLSPAPKPTQFTQGTTVPASPETTTPTFTQFAQATIVTASPSAVAPTVTQFAQAITATAPPSPPAPTSSFTSIPTPPASSTSSGSSAEPENRAWWLPVAFLIAALATVACIALLRASRRTRESAKN